VTSEPVEEAAAVEKDVRRSLYLQENDSSGSSSSPHSDISCEKELEAALGNTDIDEKLKRLSRGNRNSILMEAQIDQKPTVPIKTLAGRPDLTAIVKSVVKGAEQRDTVAVGGRFSFLIPNEAFTDWSTACGPTELMRVARNAVADSITITGPSVTLHCEQFGWG
jgi:hypothetical protein